jgi:hypothetical protein
MHIVYVQRWEINTDRGWLAEQIQHSKLFRRRLKQESAERGNLL